MTLVTGFLGSGKTTLLREAVAIEVEKRAPLALLINEFAPLDVDGDELRRGLGETTHVVPIPGGSIFCTCLVARFIGEMRGLIARHEVAPFDAVLVEASGAANPAVVHELLEQTGLDQSIELNRVVCVVDPVSLPKLIETLPNIRAQLAAADTVVLNKADLAETAARARCTAVIAEHAPDATVTCCEHALPCPDLLTPVAELPHVSGPLAECRDPNFARCVFQPRGPVQRDALLAVLREWWGSAYRVKGTIDTDAGPVTVSLSESGLEWLATQGAAATGLVLIARPAQLPGLSRALNRLSPLPCQPV